MCIFYSVEVQPFYMFVNVFVINILCFNKYVCHNLPKTH